MYDFDDEKKKSLKKKTEFLFRRIITGLQGQKYKLFLYESQLFDIKHDLKS